MSKLFYDTKDEVLEDIRKAEKQADNILKELGIFIKSQESFSIKTELIHYPKGFAIGGKLIQGENLVKEYNQIDLLFLDLENLMFNILLKQ